MADTPKVIAKKTPVVAYGSTLRISLHKDGTGLPPQGRTVRAGAALPPGGARFLFPCPCDESDLLWPLMSLVRLLLRLSLLVFAGRGVPPGCQATHELAEATCVRWFQPDGPAFDEPAFDGPALSGRPGARLDGASRQERVQQRHRPSFGARVVGVAALG